MTDTPLEIPRRTLLQATAALAAASALGLGPSAAAVPNPTPGKPGDFDFLAGNWAIKHKRLKTAHTQDWDEFEGEATCWTILGGVASIEELRIPARDFSGMGLRLLDVTAKVWTDFWVNGKSGVLTPPGMTGSFENGEGIFSADDMDGDKPIKVKGVWDRITPASCRWYQAVSWDDGKTWEENWLMDWTKV
ncbi:hypothetical protein sos41_27600 [Alphaproteobacteria bacterium SO-S41]|nr:hypothetical protein sos41_27600 [Alphaproteobacteria bacterium SO-S41]